MKNALKAVSCFAAIAAIVLATSFTPATLAGTSDTNASSAAGPKTYKRRCTNYKCKIVSESTKPSFKCPHCGSSTVGI